MWEVWLLLIIWNSNTMHELVWLENRRPNDSINIIAAAVYQKGTVSHPIKTPKVLRAIPARTVIQQMCNIM